MSDRQWFRIRSWHILFLSWEADDQPGFLRSLCGRFAPLASEASDTLPVGKSCETCLRIHARQTDKPA